MNETIINSTFSNHTDNVDHNIFKDFAVQLIFFTLYAVIFIVGLLGNSVVLFIVFKEKTMRTVTNLFIANLAVSDILLCIFCATLTPFYTIKGEWVFGNFLCHLTAFLQCLCEFNLFVFWVNWFVTYTFLLPSTVKKGVYLSSFTLTSIAIDRFYVIFNPMESRMRLKSCVLILIAIWTASCGLSFPFGYFMEAKMIQLGRSRAATICYESWPQEEKRLDRKINLFVCD